VASLAALPVFAAALWLSVPREIFERLATIPSQLTGGDLNQRLNIWEAGWHALVRAPFIGSGAGSFVAAAGLATDDTAHNTALSIAVELGVVGLLLASAILLSAIALAARTHGVLRWGLATGLVVWLITSSASTVAESRTTWLLLAMVALAGRLAEESPGVVEEFFSGKTAGAPLTAAIQSA
ncbi:MAG: O-antigen ligase family protein, partial [Terracidiphilus sp.]